MNIAFLLVEEERDKYMSILDVADEKVEDANRVFSCARAIALNSFHRLHAQAKQRHLRRSFNLLRGKAAEHRLWLSQNERKAEAKNERERRMQHGQLSGAPISQASTRQHAGAKRLLSRRAATERRTAHAAQPTRPLALPLHRWLSHRRPTTSPLPDPPLPRPLSQCARRATSASSLPRRAFS
jgi:hypothetical protein